MWTVVLILIRNYSVTCEKNIICRNKYNKKDTLNLDLKKKLKMVGKKGKAKKVETPEVSEEEQEHQETKSTFLGECEQAFGVVDFYAILQLEKGKATASDSKCIE